MLKPSSMLHRHCQNVCTVSTRDPWLQSPSRRALGKSCHRVPVLRTPARGPRVSAVSSASSGSVHLLSHLPPACSPQNRSKDGHQRHSAGAHPGALPAAAALLLLLHAGWPRFGLPGMSPHISTTHTSHHTHTHTHTYPHTAYTHSPHHSQKHASTCKHEPCPSVPGVALDSGTQQGARQVQAPPPASAVWLRRHTSVKVSHR